jgi:threonine dehydrogenase-like Zn-dependent dehydrogenase
MQTLMANSCIDGRRGDALQWAINSVKKGGSFRSSAFTVRSGRSFPIGNVVNKGLTLRGNQRR